MTGELPALRPPAWAEEYTFHWLIKPNSPMICAAWVKHGLWAITGSSIFIDPFQAYTVGWRYSHPADPSARVIDPGNEAPDPPKWKCGALPGMSGLGGNTPSECNWPFCGCDPYADKVIVALQECGVLMEIAPDPRDAEIERLREIVKTMDAALVFYASRQNYLQETFGIQHDPRRGYGTTQALVLLDRGKRAQVARQTLDRTAGRDRQPVVSLR